MPWCIIIILVAFLFNIYRFCEPIIRSSILFCYAFLSYPILVCNLAIILILSISSQPFILISILTTSLKLKRNCVMFTPNQNNYFLFSSFPSHHGLQPFLSLSLFPPTLLAKNAIATWIYLKCPTPKEPPTFPSPPKSILKQTAANNRSRYWTKLHNSWDFFSVTGCLHLFSFLLSEWQRTFGLD